MNNVNQNDQHFAVERDEPVGTVPQPLHKQKPKPQYTMTVDESGQPVATPITQSPFSLDLIRRMRGNVVVMEQLQRGRPLDLLEHRRVMLEEIGPALERKHNCSAKRMFLHGGDSDAMQRVHRSAPDDYVLLKELSYYLDR